MLSRRKGIEVGPRLPPPPPPPGVFVNAAGSQIPRSITQPPDRPNTINSSSISPPPVNDDWLIFEILTRLPVKTLFRFKTVSKRWCSLIEKDQNFIDSHFLNRSKTSLRRLFIVNPVPCLPEIAEEVYDDYYDENLCRDTWPYNEIYITADLMLLFGDDHKGGGGDTSATSVVMVDTVREVDSTNYDYVSNPVNGLICLIESSFEYVVRICNISTRELSPWFESSLLSEEKEIDGIRCRRMQYRDAKPNYQFGFDPSTNEHKLVCLWKVTSSDLKRKQLICEVLTIGRQGIHGDNRWRRIEEVPYSLGKDSVYVNGVIYWSSSDLHFGFWNNEYRPIVIVAFDVGREKFRNIIVPDFILDQPPCCFQGGSNNLNSPSYYLHGERVNLLEVCGRLSMLVQMSNRLFKMYIYEEDDYKLKDGIYSSGGSFSSINNGTWSDASTITLPFSLGKEYGFRFCKFVGSDDEIIITLSEEPDCDKEVGKKCVSFYSYNWKKGSWREFEVSGIPSSVPHLCTESYVTSFSDSLLPINNDKVLF